MATFLGNRSISSLSDTPSGSSKRPSHHVNTFFKNSFRNPWPSAAPWKWQDLNQLPLEWMKADELQVAELKVKLKTPVDWKDDQSDCVQSGRVGVTWLGHAGFLVQMPTDSQTINVLFDPIFSSRSSPTQYIGPSRLIEAPCKVEELPGVDYVCISHNHYDHLDLFTIQEILKHFPSARYLVPLQNRKWMIDVGAKDENVIELDWWGIREFSDIKFTCVPAQHQSGRSVHDQCSTLWSGWVAETSNKEIPITVYHAGDTGYRSSEVTCPIFKEIGERFGPITLSMIPIWRGGSLSFISAAGFRLRLHALTANVHGDPRDAVDIHLDVKSKNSIGMHFGTFVGSHGEGIEPIVMLSRTLAEKGIKEMKRGDKEEGGMGIMDVGETRWFSP